MTKRHDPLDWIDDELAELDAMIEKLSAALAALRAEMPTAKVEA